MLRRTYVRSMDGWWRRNPYFVRYMAREVTAVFVVLYALILLMTLVNLAEGEASFDAWVGMLRTPGSIALHALLLAVFLYHTKSWFDIMPKTMPPIVVAGKRVSASAITGAGIAASLAASLILLALVKALA
jgi:fumarate reductase subunit C